jgi:uncharacterized membrane protein YjgN (DUF898 family)
MADTNVSSEKKGRSGGIAFSGTGSGLLGFCLLICLSAALLLIPLPFVTVGIRKWFYKNLDITNRGQKAVFSFDGGGAGLLKYWIPALVLLAISGGAFYWGIAGNVDGFMTFLLIVISIVALFPLAWLWTAKKRYTVAHTRVDAGGEAWRLAFSGQGSGALRYGLFGIFSLFIAGLALPWAAVGALKWCLESTEINRKDKDLKATFSGKGGSLFWYGIGLAISPLFLFLILPALLRGLIGWVARFVNVIGLDETIEFEFKGKSGPLFGYVYLTLAITIGAFVLNAVLGSLGLPEAVLFAAVVLFFGVTMPFVAAAFLRWCAANIDIVEK